MPPHRPPPPTGTTTASSPHLAHQLQADGGCAFGGAWPVEGVDHAAALVGHQLVGQDKRLVNGVGEEQLGLLLSAGGDARRAGVARHGELGVGADGTRRKRHRHRVVAGAGRDHAALAGRFIQRQQAVEGTPQLETAGALKQLQLQPHLGARVEKLRGGAGLPAPHRRGQDVAGQTGGGVFDLKEAGVGDNRRHGARGKQGHGNSPFDSIERRASSALKREGDRQAPAEAAAQRSRRIRIGRRARWGAGKKLDAKRNTQPRKVCASVWVRSVRCITGLMMAQPAACGQPAAAVMGAGPRRCGRARPAWRHTWPGQRARWRRPGFRPAGTPRRRPRS